jgi:hypothetical protein
MRGEPRARQRHISSLEPANAMKLNRRSKRPASLRWSAVRLRVEALEPRQMMAFGDPIQMLESPAGIPEAGALFGFALADSANIQGAPFQDGQQDGVLVHDAGAGGILGHFDPTPEAGNGFGYAVAQVSDKYIYGAPFDDTGAIDTGIVHIFGSSGFPRTIENPAPQAGDGFGMSLSGSSTYLVVGAPLDDAGAVDSGTVYLYDTTAGQQTPLLTLNNPSPSQGDRFGTYVRHVGNYILVGAPGDDTKATDAGAAYVFDATSGELVQTVYSPSPTAGEGFGTSIVMLGEELVVAAPGYDADSLADVGRVYSFSTSTWQSHVTFDNPTPGANDRFGSALMAGVYVTNNTANFVLVVGAPGDDGKAVDAGAAYVFRSSGELYQALYHADPSAGDQFGFSLGGRGDEVRVGTPYDDVAGAVDAGSILSFKLSTGKQTNARYNIDPPGAFGRALAFLGDRLFVAEPYDASGNYKSNIYEYDFTTGELIPFLTAAVGGPAISGMVAEGNRILVRRGSLFNDYEVYDATTKSLLSRFSEEGTPTLDGDLVFFGNEDYGGGNGTITVRSALTGEILRQITSHSPDVVLYPSGRIDAFDGEVAVVGSSPSHTDNSVYIYDSSTGELLETLRDTENAPNGWPGPVVVAGDSVFVGGFGVVYQFSRQTGKVVRTFASPTSFSGLSLAVNGEQLIVASSESQGKAYVYDLATGRRLASLSNSMNGEVTQGEEQFGASIAANDKFIAVAAPFRRGLVPKMGAVLLYQAEWNHLQIDAPTSFSAPYTENDPPVSLVSDATISNPRNVSLDGGKLEVVIDEAHEGDHLAIATTGTGAEQVTTAENTVTYGGVVIGTFTGGVDVEPLIVTFNSLATTASVQAVLRSFTFESIGETPWGGWRRISITLRDGEGETTDVAKVNGIITVVSVPDAPALTVEGNLEYRENDPPILLAPEASFADVDGFTWGTLTVSIQDNADPQDRIAIRDNGSLRVEYTWSKGGRIYYEDRELAWFNDGIGGEPFSAWTSVVSPADMELMLRSLTFSTTSESELPRTIRFVVTDNEQASNQPAAKTVYVTATNDAPQIVNAGAEASYTENAAAIAIAPLVTIVDADSTNFNTGKLTVQFATDAESTDRLSIRSAGDLVVSGQELKFKGILIGTFTGGVGTEPLVVTFNEKASPFRAQMVLRSITYRSLSESPSGTPRQLVITLTDGDGGMSSPVSKTITVTPVNDAPKLNTALSPTLTAINENNRNAWGTPVWTLLPGYSDVDAGALKGLAITSASGATQGAWQYTLDGGASWLDLGAVGLSAAKLLPAQGNLARVRFVPDANFHGTMQLGYFAWDQTQGVAGGTFDLSGSGKFGGTTAFSWGYETASLTVNPVNTPPVLTLPSAPVGYALNSPAVLLASTATVKDPDTVRFEGGWLKVEITAGADANDRLSIGGPFKVVEGNLIWNNQETIGTVQGGAGSEALLIQLNANATRYRVEQLVRSIKFGTLGSSQTGQRTVAFSVSDGTSDSNVATLDVQVA